MKPCPIDILLAKKALGEWAYEHESTIRKALQRCYEEMPASMISQYERCLDALEASKADVLRSIKKGKQQ